MQLLKKLGLVFLGIALVAIAVFLWPREPEVYRYGKMTYDISAGEVIITDCDPSASGKLEVPATIDGSPVTGIARAAFRDCARLQQIIVPESVTFVGENAFAGCDALEYNLYDNARYLGNEENPYLILVSTVSKDITHCTIHEGTRFIYDYAFESCKQLITVTIPEKVTAIGTSAFDMCVALESVMIPDTVTQIGDRAFCGCSALTAVDLPEAISFVGDAVFYYCTGLTEVTIPTCVTAIGREAFYRCSGLTTLSLPATITEIGDSAFYGCSALTEVDYSGTQAQWEAISLGQSNESLLPAQGAAQG